MQTNSFCNWQFSAEPCKGVSFTFSKHVLASKAFKFPWVSVVNTSSSEVLPYRVLSWGLCKAVRSETHQGQCCEHQGQSRRRGRRSSKLCSWNFPALEQISAFQPMENPRPEQVLLRGTAPQLQIKLIFHKSSLFAYVSNWWVMPQFLFEPRTIFILFSPWGGK